jgi:hypothetical protein
MPDEISSHTMETAIPAWAKQHGRNVAADSEHDPAAPDAQQGSQPLTQSAPSLPYEEYLRQRYAFVEAGQRGRQRLDQLLIAGATGALVLSVTFLEKIAPTPDVASRPFLLAGWLVLLTAMALSMLGHEASCRAFEAGIRGLDRQLETGTLYDPTTNVWDRRTALLNRLSLAAFFVGIALLVYFAFLNVPFRS